jgi:hypothetical protein
MYCGGIACWDIDLIFCHQHWDFGASGNNIFRTLIFQLVDDAYVM